MAFAGGCMCGAIRYECDGKPLTMFQCHCTDCQHISGGPFTAVVYVRLESYKITKGTPRYYFTDSEMGGKNKRGFCGDCGSRISGGETETGIGINAGSLDDPSWFSAHMHIFASDAQPWDAIDPAIPQFETYPPM